MPRTACARSRRPFDHDGRSVESQAEPKPRSLTAPERHGLHRARPGTVHARFSRPGLAVVAASLLGLVAWGCGSGGDADQAARTAGAAAGGPGTVAAAVRVDQLGFTPEETKTAYLLTASRGPSSFAVVDDAGRTVLSGRAKASRGRWNRRYGAVRPLDLTALRALGTYRIRVAGITSAPFRVAPSAELFGPRIDDAVAFFRPSATARTSSPARCTADPRTSTTARTRVRLAPLRERRTAT